jgi:LysM repeat protein
MDTISRDNNSSYLPVAGVIVGLLALVLSAVSLVKVASANKQLADHETKVSAIEAQANTAAQTADKAAKDLTRLATQTQDAVTQIGTMIGDIRGSITKIEEAQKKPAAVAKGASKEPVVAGPGEYVVKSGDSGAKIAREHNVSLGDLQTVNPSVNWSALKPGQKIKLPQKK